jgi:Zn-dependent peptidase ImmA (M78 family)
MTIDKLVSRLVKKYQTTDPFLIADYLGAIVVLHPLVGIRGFHQYAQRNHIIYIDSNLPEHQQKLVCAHELGHMLLHPKTNSFAINVYTSINTARLEKEANCFAAALLIPSEELREHNHYTIDQLASLYGYDRTLIELRLTMEV